MYKVAIAALLVLPLWAGAAGFSDKSIFLSRSPVTEGESVRIHAVVANEASTTFSGSVVLKEGDNRLGSVPVTLKSGEALAVSVAWKPAAGSHKVTAQLVTKGGDITASESETFTIKELPKPRSEVPAAQDAAAIQSSQGIEDGIAGVSPGVAGALAPAFTVIDSARQKAADFLEARVLGAQSSITEHPMDKQTEVGGMALPDPMNGFWWALYTILLYVCTLLGYVVSNAGIFYPVVALLFLYVLFRMFKRFRRA